MVEPAGLQTNHCIVLVSQLLLANIVKVLYEHCRKNCLKGDISFHIFFKTRYAFDDVNLTKIFLNQDSFDVNSEINFSDVIEGMKIELKLIYEDDFIV